MTFSLTGGDLCQSMLNKLLKKHSDKRLTIVYQDYYKYECQIQVGCIREADIFLGKK